MNIIQHSRILRVLACRLYHITVNVIALNLHRHIPLNQILCLIYRIVPKLLRHKMRPILGQNSRFMPGAIFTPIMAASIGMLPLPQNGSTKMRSSLHGVNKRTAYSLRSSPSSPRTYRFSGYTAPKEAPWSFRTTPQKRLP